jgi:preprotein translocase subunit YajC
LLRRFLPYTTVLVFLAALYAGWTFYSRRQSAAEAERQAQQKQADEDRRVITRFGGDELKILSFGAAKGEIAPGERVVLCYGVSNAAQVKIEPDVEPVKPAVSHCLEVFPKKTTTYTLKADDAKGASKRASVTVWVR